MTTPQTKHFKKTRYKGPSIVDGLKRSIFGPRWKWRANAPLFAAIGTLEEIAQANDLSYAHPRTAHIAMLELLKQGTLVRPDLLHGKEGKAQP